MSLLQKSLNSFVSWTQLLQVLGVDPKTQALPAKVACPVCRSPQCLIFQNRAEGGQWHYCQSCGSFGDLIELAARVWRISESSAVTKMVAEGVTIPTSETTLKRIIAYLEEFPTKRKLTRQAWDKIRLGAISGETVARMQALSLWHSMGAGKVETQQRRLVAGTTRKELEAQFNAGRKFAPLAGRGWQDLLILPFFVNPQQLSGFSVIGRENEYPADFTYVPLTKYDEDAGLWMPDNLDTAARLNNNTVFVMQDITTALKFQLKHLHSASLPLPLACYHYDVNFQTTHSWKLLEGYKQIHWHYELDPVTFKHAVENNACVSLAGPPTPTAKAVQRWRRDGTILDMLSKLINSSKAWPESLRDSLEVMTQQRIDDFFLGLELYGAPMEKIYDSCTASMKAKIDNVKSAATAGRSVFIDGFEISEKPDGWFARSRRNQQELVCNAPIHIHKVVHHAKSGKTRYIGEVRTPTGIVAFNEDRATVEKKTTKWLQELLLKTGNGMLQYSPRWAAKLTAISSQFHTAEAVEAVPRIGWNQEEAAFVFPGFAMTDRGLLADNVNVVLDASDPCYNFSKPPGVVTPNYSDAADAQTTTQLLSVLAANILAPAFGEQARVQAVRCSRNLAAFVVASKQAGCRVLELKTRADVVAALEEETQHNWPVVVWSDKSGLFSELLSSSEASRNLVCLMDDATANWAVLETGIPVLDPAGSRLCADVQPVLLAYLQNVCERRLMLDSVDSWTDTVAQDFENWAVLALGYDFATTPQDTYNKEDLLWDQLIAAVLDGSIQSVPSGFETPGKAEVILGDNTALLTFAAIKKLSPKRIAIGVNYATATSMLSKKIATEPTADGWLLNKYNWMMALRQARDDEALKLIA